MRNQQLIEEVLKQPDAQDSRNSLSHFNGLQPSTSPSDFSDLEGYGVVDDYNGTY